MRKDRERRRPARDDVRAQVLAAAREVFGEVGYHAASTAEIVRRAGFTKGALYSNFTGKEDLFLALVEEETAARVEHLASSASFATEDVASSLLAFVRDSRAGLVFAEFRAQADLEPAARARLADVRGRLIDTMADRMEAELGAAGLRLTMPAVEAATLVVALVNGLTLEQVGLDRPVVPAESLARLLAGLVTTPGAAG